MRRWWRKSALALGVIVVGLLIAAAIVLRPYYRMPPDREELSKRLASFHELAQSIEARPDRDRRLFYEMIEDAAPMLRMEFEWTESECPPKAVRQWKKHEAKYPAVPGFDRKIQTIVKDGFVLQQPIAVDTKFPKMKATIRWFGLEALTAVRHAAEGDNAAATKRLEYLAAIDQGFYDSRIIYFVMLASHLEAIYQKATLALLPQLSDRQLADVEKHYSEFPNPAMLLADAIRLEAVAIEELFETNRLEMTGSFRMWLLRAALRLGYAEREKWMLVSFLDRQIRTIEQWAAAGATTALPEAFSREELKYSPLSVMAMPDLSGVARGVQRTLRQRAAVLEALRAEKAFRQDSTPRPPTI